MNEHLSPEFQKFLSELYRDIIPDFTMTYDVMWARELENTENNGNQNIRHS